MNREVSENGRVSLLAVAFLVVVLAVGFILAGPVEAGECPTPAVILDERGEVIAMRPDPAMVAAPYDSAQLQMHSATVTPTLDNTNLRVRGWSDDPVPMDFPFRPDRVVWEDATNSANPRMVADPNTGWIWVAFTHDNGADDDVFLAYSDDLGVNWNWMLNTAGTFNERNPSIDISVDTIMIWYEQDEVGSEQHMNFLMSQDGGQSWNAYYMNWDWTNDPSRERQEDFHNVQVTSKRAATWWIAADSYHPAQATRTVVFMMTDDESNFQMWYYITDPWHIGVDWQRPDITENNANNDMNIAWEIWNATELGYDIQWVIYDVGMNPVNAWWTPLIDDGNTEIYPEFYIRDDIAYLVWQNGTSPADITAFYSDDGGNSALWILFITRQNGFDEHAPEVYVDSTFEVHISAWNESRISYLNNSNVLVDPFSIMSADDFPGAAADVFRSSDIIEFANSPRIVWTDDRNFTLGIYYTDLGINDVTYTFERSPGIANGTLLVDGTPCWGTCQYVWSVGSLHDIEAPQYMNDVPLDARFVFNSWSDGGAMVHQIQVAPSDTTITANYDPQYNITVETLPDPNLEIVIDATPYVAPQSFWWTLGQVHTLDVTSPQAIDGTSRWVWASWSDAGGKSHPVTVTMPVVYTATFTTEYMVNITTNPPGLTVEVDGLPYSDPVVNSFWWLDGSVHNLNALSPQPVSPDEQLAWQDWSDAGAQQHDITVIGPDTFTANYITQYNISFTTSPAGLEVEVDGIVYPSPVYFFWDVGSVHTINAPSPQPIGPTSQYTWLSWNDAGAQTHDVTVIGPATYTANFGIEYRIDVNTNPIGLNITVDAVEYTAPYSFWCAQGSSAMLGAPSPQPQTPTMQYIWSSWSDMGTQTHPIICNMANTYTANFVAQYEVTVDTDPAGLLVEVGGIQYTAPYVGWHTTGDVVTLNAPSPQTSGTWQAVWDHWNDAQPQTHQVTITGPSTYIAYFDAQFLMTVTSTPVTGLNVEVDGMPQVTEYQFWCDDGTLHTVNALSPQNGPVANSRYVWIDWSDGLGQSHTVVCDGPNIYTANYVLEYQVTITTNPAGLQVEVDGVTRNTPYQVWWVDGSVHSINALSPQDLVPGSSRYEYASWSDAGAQQHDITVTGADTFVAAYDLFYRVTVTSDPAGLDIVADSTTYATPYSTWWEEGTSHALDVPDPQNVAAGERYVFDQWSDAQPKSHNIIVAMSTTYTAYMTHQFEVTIDSMPQGITVTIDSMQYTTPVSFWWDEGTSHSISAVDYQTVGAGVRYAFASWSDSGAITHNIVADTAKTLTANYNTEYQVTVATLPTGLEIVVDMVTYTAPQSFWWVEDSNHDIGVTSPQDLGVTGEQFVWASWSDTGTQTHSVTATAAITHTASFTTQYYLTVDSPQGTTSGEGWYDAGTTANAGLDVDTVTVGATQYVFAQWTGDASGTNYAQSSDIVMDAPKTATAMWTTQYYLTVTSTHGDPQGDGWYDSGSTATFSVTTPWAGTTGTQYVFSAWSGDSTATTASASVTMNQAKTVTAQWTTQYYLTVVSAYGNPTGENWYNSGATATFSVTSPSAGTTGTQYVLSTWTGDSTATTATATISMTAPRTVTAQWTIQHYLTVISVNGRGNPTGEGWYDEGTQATFSVTSPTTDDGVEYAFTGWSGDSTSGSKTATITMTGPMTVEAKWEESGFLAKFWWLIPLIIIIIIIAIVAILMMKRRKPEEEELPPPEEMEIPPEEE